MRVGHIIVIATLAVGHTSLFGTETRRLGWREIRIVSADEAIDQPRIVIEAKSTKDNHWESLVIEAFGSRHALERAQLKELDGYDLRSIQVLSDGRGADENARVGVSLRRIVEQSKVTMKQIVNVTVHKGGELQISTIGTFPMDSPIE
jgi:hypothetical protein